MTTRCNAAVSDGQQIAASKPKSTNPWLTERSVPVLIQDIEQQIDFPLGHCWIEAV